VPVERKKIEKPQGEKLSNQLGGKKVKQSTGGRLQQPKVPYTVEKKEYTGRQETKK